LIDFSNALATEGIGYMVIEIAYTFPLRIIETVIQPKTGEFARPYLPERCHESCLLSGFLFQ
jgi:hypothetical protein